MFREWISPIAMVRFNVHQSTERNIFSKRIRMNKSPTEINLASADYPQTNWGLSLNKYFCTEHIDLRRRVKNNGQDPFDALSN